MREVTVVTPWLYAVRATGAGLALRAGVALGVVTGAVAAAGVGAAMPCSAAVTPFGTTVAHDSEEAAGGRQETVAGGSEVPSPATAHSPSPAPSSAPLPFRLAEVAGAAAGAAATPSLWSSAQQPSRAGSRPGEGRKRPGREVPGAEGRSERPEGSEGTGKADPQGERDGGPSDGRRGTGDDDGASPVPELSGPGDDVSGVPEKPGGAHVGAEDGGSAPHSGDSTDGAKEPGAGATHRTPPSQDAAATVTSDMSRQHAAKTGTGTERSTGPVLRILPLGGGLVLMGLGLGLAFVGLRLRRS
ncbi:hypothetical protein GCM10027162_76440 [Streptomyces incanus]